MDIENKVLQDIIDMLDEQEGEKLKKHPKLMALQVEVGKKPEMAEGEGEEEDPEHEASESPEELSQEGEMSPEMIKKVLEMYEKMK